MKGKRWISLVIAVFILLNSYSIVLAQDVLVTDVNTDNLTEEETTKPQTIGELNERRNEMAAKIEEAMAQLEVVQEELTQTLNEIATLQQSVDAYQVQVDNLKGNLTQLQGNIEKAEEDLGKAEEECKKQEDLLTTRLVTMYQAGETSYLDFLLTSKNLIEFISNYYLLVRMTEWDNKILEDLEGQRNLIQEQKNQLDKNKADLKELKAKAEQSETLLKNTQALQQIKKETLNEEELKIQQEIDAYRQEQYLMEEQIQLAIQNSQINIRFMGNNMIWPVGKANTYITSYYGIREHPILGIVKKHSGLDIGNTPYGTPALAAADGVVSFAGVMSGYGNCVMVNHGDGVTTLYGHGQKILTELGATVKQGDVIMEIGSTGRSTGPHLHFEVRINGSAVNPLTYLQAGQNVTE